MCLSEYCECPIFIPESEYKKGTMHISRATVVSNARSFTLLSLVFGAASLCSADPITYNVNQTVGAGSVIGTVETDGTIGVLLSSNVIGFNLLLNDGINTFDDISGGPQSEGFVRGSDLSATATQLLFNFSSTNGSLFLLEFDGSQGTNFWCAQTSFVAGGCSAGGLGITPSGETFDIGIHSPASHLVDPGQFTAISGTQVIAAVGPAVASAPEPSTLALLAAGMALIGFGKSKHKEQRSN